LRILQPNSVRKLLAAQGPYGGNRAVAFHFESLCDREEIVVCVSEAERGKLLLLYPDLEAKTCVIHNGLSALSPREVRVSEDRKAFGFLGRCDYRKGLREAIRAFSAIDGNLTIACGEEDEVYKKEAEEDVRRYELGDRVNWVGRLEGDGRKAEFFDRLDALIVPSLWEPFGYVVLEALRAGVPPIVGSRGGMTEIVGEHYPYIFDPWDRESLVKCVSTFQNDPADIIKRETEKAIRHAERLTGERMAKEYEGLAVGVAEGRCLPAFAGPVAGPVAGRKRRYALGGDGGDGFLGRNASSTPPLSPDV
jgi:glycosyltransferase involved in cell wall biosynthesis